MKIQVTEYPAANRNSRNVIALNHKASRTRTATATEDKVTQLFRIADYFCKVFKNMTAEQTIKNRFDHSHLSK